MGRIEQLLLQLTGRKCHLRIESSGGQADASAPIAEVPENSQSRSPSLSDEAAEAPLVKWAKDLLGANPIKVDPGFGASAPTWAERADQADAEEP